MDTNIEQTVNKKRKSVPVKTRAFLQKEINSKCPLCSSEEVEQFQVHHIDSNCENNDLGNLILLCPTCHSKITKGDIPESKVKEVKIALSKDAKILTALEMIELEDERFKYENERKKYLGSNKANDDMRETYTALVSLLNDQCVSIQNKNKNFYLAYSKRENGFVQIAFSHIYILLQFHPQDDEYQLSCTFNKGWRLSEDNRRRPIFIKRFKFDINLMNELGWNENDKFYNNEEIANYLITELYQANKSYSRNQ